MLLPTITDLRWYERKKDYLDFTWTNPAFRIVRVPDLPIHVVDYDVRFLPNREMRTERDFAEATRIRYESDGLVSSGPKRDAHARVYHPHGAEHAFRMYFIDLPTMQSQFRERSAGSYALRYCDRNLGWSPVSNVLWDRAAGAHKQHEFQIRVGKSASAGPAFAAGLLFVEIRDPVSKATRQYTVNTKGWSIGGPVGATKPVNPKLNRWTEFSPRTHLHLKDFNALGIRVMSQGVALTRGWGRSQIRIYTDERSAAAEDESRLVAGPIHLSGAQSGLELNLLSDVVGRLDAR